MLKFFFTMLLLIPTLASAARYEAESATISGGATVNGAYVEMKQGNLTFNVSVESAGTYDIIIRYKQDYDDSKTQNLVINGNGAGGIVFPRTANPAEAKAVAPLKAGANTIAITNSWGYVDIDYIDVENHENTPFELSPNTANPNANEQAKKVFAFLQENFQKKIISGVMTSEVVNGNNAVTLNNQTEIAHIRASSGNKTPALVGLDFMHGTGKSSEQDWFKNYTKATISLAKELWERGGIPAFCWHWKDPLKNVENFYSPEANVNSTNFDLTAACTNVNCDSWNINSSEYKAIVADIDIVAGYLKELQTAGVAVLWRPIHEASGGWFWWGVKGANAFKLLYKLMFDKLTDEHKLNNLIWVWNSEGGGDANWYPGNDYVDIIGRDYYFNPRKTDHSSLIGEFESLKNTFGTSKIIALSENGSVPYPDNLVADGAGWSFFMPWYGGYVTNDNSASDWNTIMNHDYVLTLEEMPGWDSYEPPEEPPVPILSQAANVSFDYRSVDFSKIALYNARGVKVSARSWGELPNGVYVVKFLGTNQKFIHVVK